MVRVNVVFRGREVTHPELGVKVLEKIIDATKDFAKVETANLMPNKHNNYFVIFRKGENIRIKDEVIKKLK